MSTWCWTARRARSWRRGRGIPRSLSTDVRMRMSSTSTSRGSGPRRALASAAAPMMRGGMLKSVLIGLTETYCRGGSTIAVTRSTTSTKLAASKVSPMCSVHFSRACMVTIKTVEDIILLREGGARLGKILSLLSKKVAPGLRTSKLEAEARRLIAEGGDTPSFLNYQPEGAKRSYPAALCVSINDEVVHGLPGERV